MGCFSDDQPTYEPPAPPKLQSAADIYGEATNWANTNFPAQMQAQAQALANVNNPNYYAQWQPTSFEQALGNQQFKNIWPDQEAYMMNKLSQSGMAYSPVAATTLGNAYGNLSTQIGEYLSNQGNQRATNAINAGLNMSPMNYINPYANTSQQQGNSQANLDYGYQQAQAQQAYQQQMNNYQNEQAFAKMLGGVSILPGNIYNATQGDLGSGLAGSMNTIGSFAPFAMGQGGGFGGGFGTGPTSNNALTMTGMLPNSANSYNQDIGSQLGSGYLNQENPFSNSSSMAAGFNNTMGV